MGSSLNYFDRNTDMLQYLEVEFINMDEGQTSLKRHKARKCTQNDFRHNKKLYESYVDRQIHLICPEGLEKALLAHGRDSIKLESFSVRVSRCSGTTVKCAKDIEAFFAGHQIVTNLIHPKVDMLYHNRDLWDPKNLPVMHYNTQLGRFNLKLDSKNQKFLMSEVDIRPNHIYLEDDIFQMTQHENLTFVDTEKSLVETFELPPVQGYENVLFT